MLLLREKVMQKNKELVVQLIEEVWSKGNLLLVDTLIAKEYKILHDPGDPWESKLLDHAEFKKRVMLSREVFPDLLFTLKDVVSEENRVTISWFMTGTQKGEIPGVLHATNKFVKVSGLTIYYFSDDKIAAHWQVVDRLSLLEQLGITIGRGS